ncbi:MAG: hypothetical protein IPH63_08175 [Flavobacteriales bacterium]|nr:hypothetical protein [Flavobacteriales bacterium]
MPGELGCKVSTLERHKPLYLQTKERLKAWAIGPAPITATVSEGLPKEAPLRTDPGDLWCAVDGCAGRPLESGGSLVIPVGEGEEQRMFKLERKVDGAMAKVDHGAFRFVPMLQDKSDNDRGVSEKDRIFAPVQEGINTMSFLRETKGNRRNQQKAVYRG